LRENGRRSREIESSRKGIIRKREKKKNRRRRRE
jgi:hypothetical protein